MSVLVAKADGNFTATTTWYVADTTSYMNSENASTVVTTSFQRCAAFTPGAITIDGIGIKLYQRTGSTGTLTVQLDLDTTDTLVTGTDVTVNMSDIPADIDATGDIGGWFFLKFAAPVTLSAATAYQVAYKTSSASQLALARDNTGANIARFLRTTTEPGSVAAGDDFIITKEWTAAATGTARTVTMNSTSATDYGSANTLAVSPAIAVSIGGTLTFGTAAATNYVLRISGYLVVYAEGTVSIGTTGTPIPRDSTAVLEFDCAADGDFGIVLRTGAIFNAQGQSRTSGKNVAWCKLYSAASAAATTLTLDADTGWKNGDEIIIAGTNMRPAAAASFQDEVRSLSADATDVTGPGYDITISSGLTNAHAGASPLWAAVGLLTRNVEIRSVTSTAAAWMSVIGSADVDIDWARFRYFGYSSTKPGIGLTFSTGDNGSVAFNYCCFRDNEASFTFTSSSNTVDAPLQSVVWNDNVFYNTGSAAGAGYAAHVGMAGHSAAIEFKRNLLVRDQHTSGHVIFGAGIDIEGCVFAQALRGVIFSSRQSGFNGGANSANDTVTGSFDNYSSTRGIDIQNTTLIRLGTVNVIGVGGVTTYGVQLGNTIAGSTIDSLVLRECGSSGNSAVAISGSPMITLKALKVLAAAGPIPGSGVGVLTANTMQQSDQFVIHNYDSTVDAGYTQMTYDFQWLYSGRSFFSGPVFVNPLFAAAAESSPVAGLPSTSWYAVQRGDQTDNNDYTQYGAGRASKDTTIYDAAGASLRLTPSSYASAYRWEVPLGRVTITDGASRTISVKVRCSVSGDGADYNGQYPRLIVKSSALIGTTADTVLDTATASSDGAWETLTGTIASGDILEDGQVEIAIDCAYTGYTAGWVNVDTLSVS